MRWASAQDLVLQESVLQESVLQESVLQVLMLRASALQQSIWLLCLASLAMTLGCSSSPDLPTWRSGIEPRHPSEQGELQSELGEIDSLRQSFELEDSRGRVVRLVAERPLNGEALWRAARAESDTLFLTPKDDRDERNHLAWSALDYAERAALVKPNDSRVLGQLAWALGASTHLQPMFSRASHAQRTLEVIDATHQIDPDEVTALATLATLRLRLATLPWIASVMAVGAPEGDLHEACDLAERCVAMRPTVEHRILLAKCLIELEELDEARIVLSEALEANPQYPRDQALVDAARELLESIDD